MIAIQGLQFSYNGQATISFPDIKCEEKDILLLLGKSGVGKTTLLHLMGGLMQSDQGKIIIGNTDLSSLSSSQLDQFRGNNIGLVFQQPHFVKSISVIENLILAQTLAGNRANKELCMHFLEKLGIAYKAQDKPANLSQGEKQRLSIARALVNKPKLVLADEPTSALDDENCDAVLEMLEEMVQEVGAALIIVTHDTRLKERIPQQIILGS